MRTNVSRESRRRPSRGRITGWRGCLPYVWIVAVMMTALSISCSKEGPARDTGKLAEPLFGFYLGESRDDLFGRAKGTVSWSRLPGNKWDYRGEIYKFSGALDGTDGSGNAGSFVIKRYNNIYLSSHNCQLRLPPVNPGGLPSTQVHSNW